MATLFDNHGRPLTYARLAVTDRCNLRCFYCMPERGIEYLPKKELLTYEEIERLVRLLAGMGISKIRLTGGEPFVRADLMYLIEKIAHTPGVTEITLTTNGILTEPHIPDLLRLGVRSVNLSLDALDAGRFRRITRRDEFARVWRTLEALLQHGMQVKINAVVMENQNTEDILPLVALTGRLPVAVRFIEEMPFNGGGTHYPVLAWTHKKILDHIRQHYPTLQKTADEPHGTSANYRVPGYPGSVGIIAAFSRTFCGTCNRIRVTAQGALKTCLYDGGSLDLKAKMRAGLSDAQLVEALLHAFAHRPANGWEAEQRRAVGTTARESMSTIGG
jgi:cyclic pyranopterin phosphate synthase